MLDVGYFSVVYHHVFSARHAQFATLYAQVAAGWLFSIPFIYQSKVMAFDA